MCGGNYEIVQNYAYYIIPKIADNILGIIWTMCAKCTHIDGAKIIRLLFRYVSDNYNMISSNERYRTEQNKCDYYNDCLSRAIEYNNNVIAIELFPRVYKHDCIRAICKYNNSKLLKTFLDRYESRLYYNSNDINGTIREVYNKGYYECVDILMSMKLSTVKYSDIIITPYSKNTDK